MKLVVFSEKLWPEGSGGELATYLIIKLLASTGDFKIEVYTGTERPMIIPGVLIKPVKFLKARNKVQLYMNILMDKHYVEKVIRKADIVYIPRLSYPVIPLAKKLGKMAVVHLHDYQPISYTSVVLSSEISKPLSDFRRTLLIESTSGNPLRTMASAFATPLTWVMKKWVGMADKIICVSKRHREIMIRFAPEYKNKTIVIYNPPPEIPSIDKNLLEKPMLLYVGGDSYIKGFHILLKALKILGDERQYAFKLVLTNRYNPRSREVVEKLKRIYRFDIEVLGRIQYEKLLKLHSKAWALLMPSIYEEPLSCAALESTLLETLPIVTRVGGMIEIVGGTFAEQLLVSPNNPAELADKVKYIISMGREHILNLSSKVKAKVLEKFSRDRIRSELIKVFNEERY